MANSKGEESAPRTLQSARRSRALADCDVMPFGKYKQAGTKMDDVPMQYWRWLLDQEWCAEWPAVRDYALKKLQIKNSKSQSRSSVAPDAKEDR